MSIPPSTGAYSDLLSKIIWISLQGTNIQCNYLEIMIQKVDTNLLDYRKLFCLLKGNCSLYTVTRYIIGRRFFPPFYFHFLHFRTKPSFRPNLSWPVLPVHPCLSNLLPKSSTLPSDLLIWQVDSALQQGEPDNKPHSGWLVRGHQLVKGVVTRLSLISLGSHPHLPDFIWLKP